MTNAVRDLHLMRRLLKSPFHELGGDMDALLAVHGCASRLHQEDNLRIVDSNPQITKHIERR